MGRGRTCRFNGVGVEFGQAGLMRYGTYTIAKGMNNFEQHQYMSLICTKPKYSPAPKLKQNAIQHYLPNL